MKFDLSAWLPFLRWWPRVNRTTTRADLIAGLTGGLILVPQGVAFATIAGMPPEYGLYAAMLPAVIAALWGSSWHLVSGPTTAISIVVFATMSPLAEAGSPQYVNLVLTLTFLIGVIKLVFGILRLGALVNFVSHTVIIGFTAGAAVLIAASQVKNFFGIGIERGASVLEVLEALIFQWQQTNLYVFAVALFTVIGSVVCKKWRPKWPNMIVGMVLGSFLAALLNYLVAVTQTGITSIGALHVGFPPVSSPLWDVEVMHGLFPIALAVALLSLTEAVAVSRAIALKSGQHFDCNQEFIGQGLSNLVGSFSSGYASSGSFNRSGLNYEAGAQTPLASVYAAIVLLFIMVFLAPLAHFLPTAAMAGILFVVAWGLIDFERIRHIIDVSAAETVVLALTFLATLTVPLQYAIYIGVGLSLLMYLKRTSQPSLDDVKPVPGQMPPAFSDSTGLDDCPQLKIVRINGSIFFGAANHLQEALQRIDETEPHHAHVLLVASGINFVDLTGAHMLAQEAQRRRTLGGALYLFNVKEEPLDMLRRSGAYDTIGAENFFAMGDDVMATLKSRLNQSICSRCTFRIFTPCKA